MTLITFHRYTQCLVIWIHTLSIIFGMTTRTGVRRIGIITLMAGITIISDWNMRSGKRIEAIVIKSGWCPGILSVAAFAIGWELRGRVVWIVGLVIICRVTADTSVWCIGVVSLMTSITIVLNSGMCTDDRVEAVIKAGGCPGILRMTALTIRWELCGCVIRIRRLIVIR